MTRGGFDSFAMISSQVSIVFLPQDPNVSIGQFAAKRLSGERSTTASLATGANCSGGGAPWVASAPRAAAGRRAPTRQSRNRRADRDQGTESQNMSPDLRGPEAAGELFRMFCGSLFQ